MTHSSATILLCALCALAGCNTTTIVIADPNTGVESLGQRQLRLYLDRVRFAAFEGEPGSAESAPLQYECGAGLPAGSVQFKLPFVATNRTSTAWILTADKFELRSAIPQADAKPLQRPPLRRRAPLGRVLIEVPPDSSARFSVLVAVVGQGEVGLERLEGEYLLTVREEGETLLERELSVGSFNQGSQALRFAGFFTVGLLLLGL